MYNKHKKLIIIGAGGHGKVCSEIAISLKLWDDVLFLDDSSTDNNLNIVGKVSDFTNFVQDFDFFCAIGNNELRKNLHSKILSKNGNIVSLIHPKAIISSNVTIGIGTVVMAGAILNNNSTIKNGVIINSNSVIEHDCKVNDFVHVSPGCIISGSVNIGSETWIGSGSIVINNINISSKCLIGAGSLIVKDIAKPGKYFGHPVQNIEM